MWGRLSTCGRLPIGLGVGSQFDKPIANRPQDAILPHMPAPSVLDQSIMAEQEIRGEQRFQELLEAAPDGIMQVDAGGRIVLLNRVAERMFRYSREELLGKPVEILVP